MPCASRPHTRPARTSPVPAVASQGGPWRLERAVPFGEAITVSGPLAITVAPLRHVARSCGMSPNNRLNSPAWGVITVGAARSRIRANRALGSSAHAVSAPASRIVGAFVARAARTMARVFSFGAKPEPSATAAGAMPSSAACHRPSRTTPTMTAVTWAATISAALGSARTVTRPAPLRSAAPAASRAAPVA